MILANRSARIAAGDPDHVADTVATGWDPHADRYDPAEWVALTEYVPGDVVADLDGGRQVCTAPTDHVHHVTRTDVALPLEVAS